MGGSRHLSNVHGQLNLSVEGNITLVEEKQRV